MQGGEDEGMASATTHNTQEKNTGKASFNKTQSFTQTQYDVADSEPSR